MHAMRREARELGFVGVMSGPLVRSSYRAGRLCRAALDARSLALHTSAADDITLS
jgi:lipoyl synthase